MKQLLCLLFLCTYTFAEAQIKEHNITDTSLETEDSFGSSVAVSQNFVAVGVRGINEFTGGIQMHKGSGDNWNLHSTLIPDESLVGDWTGVAIAMSDQHLVFGAPTDHWATDETGRAFVYELVDDQWIQSTILQPASAYSKSGFGFITSLHENYIAIGAPDFVNKGSVNIYENNEGKWQHVQEIVNPSWGIRSFGGAIDMNDDWLAISAYSTHPDSIALGNRFEVYLYQRQASTWVETQVIEYEYQPSSFQTPSNSVEMSEDQLLIGNHRANASINVDGHAHVYQLIDDRWELTQQIQPDGFELNEIGRTVALGKDYAIVSCSKFPSSSASEPHHILIYNTEIKENWTLVADFAYENSSSLNWQGFDVDINDSYGVAATENKQSEHGDVYVYDLRRFVNNDDILDEHEVSIYPIPSSTQLTIENKNEEINSYKIFGQLGQLVMAENELNDHLVVLNISTLPQGNYWIKVVTKEGHLYKQFSKI